MTDKGLIEQSRQLDADIVAIPRDKVFTKRVVVTGFITCMVTICLSFGITSWRTNAAVTHEIPGLKDQIADRDQTLEAQDSIIQQQTDAIVMLLEVLRLNGIEAPEIIIRPED